MKKTIIVVGAGKGLGNAVAEKFGSNGFRVALISRNADSLNGYVKDFEAKGIEAYAFPADAAKPETLDEAFAKIKEQFGTPDVLFYNVGVTASDKEVTSKLLTERYQVEVASAYRCVELVNTEDFAQKHGAILMTGGGLAEYPTPGFVPLSVDKAALRALALILNQQLKERGVYVGTVTVAGTIAPDTYFAPVNLAEAFWNLCTERRQCEIFYEYPELKDFAKNEGLLPEQAAGAYWGKVYEITSARAKN